MKQKTGVGLWIQQILALLLKRLFLLSRRYVIAFVALFLPLILEALICIAIPSGSSLQSALTGRKSSSGTYNLNILNYKPYTMPYALTGNISLTNFQNLMQVMYTSSNRPGITLNQIGYDNISNYILQQRKADTLNLVSNYYTGMSFNLVNSTLIYANAYYSTFAYHSPGSILNEISNVILAFLNSNNLSQTITTYNTPIAATNTLTGNTFVDYLACIDTLPLSILNFVNAIIIGFIISIFVILVGREKANGSKGLQLLSGTHYIAYWISNHIFDFLICLFNISSMVCMILLVSSVKNDSTNEIYTIASQPIIGYFFLMLFVSIFCWPTYAYIWTFFFESEVIGFVVLAIVFGVVAFLDMIWSFLILLIQTDATSNSPFATLINVVRWILTGVFPNVLIKRGMFDLKISNSSFCLSSLNSLIYSMQENSLILKIKIKLDFLI